jgi:hypothetical protein
MAEKTKIEQAIEQAVSEVLEKQVPKLQRELAQCVLEKIQPQVGAAPGGSDGSATDLLQAIQTIHAGSTQKEVLRALLDCTVRWSGRSALFVVKSGAATGWQGRGFDDNDSIKDFSLDVHSAGPAEALQARTTVSCTSAEMDPNFVGQFGAPAKDVTLLMPLRLKDKVAAIVYADAGSQSGGSMDAPSLELLVAVTSAWLEVAALRKQAQKEGASDADSAEKFEPPVPVQSVPAFNDPFAAHAPSHFKATTAPIEQPVAEVVAAPAMAAAAPARATDAFAQMSPEDAEIHRKAQRFARLLMDEIKLYNQVKVTEGRKKKDLYDRLKEDIDKSRATYTKRYGNTVAASGDYFATELVRSLAEDDISILGPNFRR